MPVWQSQFTWGWRGILIWLRMMPRHPGPLIRRRQTRARPIIIRVYRKSILKVTLSLYCDKNLLSTSAVLLWGPWRITRQGLVTGCSPGTDPRLCRSSILWCPDNLDPGLPGSPGPAAANWLISQTKIAAKKRRERKNDLKSFSKLILYLNTLFLLIKSMYYVYTSN